MGFFDFLKFWKKKQEDEIVKKELQDDKKEDRPVVEPVVPPQAEPTPEVAPRVAPRPTPVVEEKDAPNEPIQTQKNTESVANTISTESANDDDEEIYEIKVHDDGGWQVIKKGADRATRRLETQSKAIEYCKEHDFNYEVYKMDGTLK